MKTSTVSLANLKIGDLRLDAGYHAADGALAREQVLQWARRSRGQITRLDEVCIPGGLFIPGRFKRVFVDNLSTGAPYLTGGDIIQSEPLLGAKLISTRYTNNLEELFFKEKTILITCSGSIGNAVYVNLTFSTAVGSPDLIRVIADPAEIPSGYLFTYLSLPSTKALIQQKTYGAVVPHIEAHHVADLPIPRIQAHLEEKIHSLIEGAAERKTTANRLLEEARTRLFALAGLPRLSRAEMLTRGCWKFSVSSRWLDRAPLTAWTYNPVTQQIVDRMQSRQHALLGNLVEENRIFYGHQFKRIDAKPAAGIMLLSQSDVFQERPQGRWISKQSVRDYREYMVPDGAILVAAQGTMGDNELFGHSQFSHRNFENRMITQHILRVFPNAEQINPGYLFAFLSSEYGFQLFRSTVCGTKLLGFILELVRLLPIPLLDRALQDEIGGMVYRAYDLRAEALALEDKAQELLIEELAV